MRKTILNKGDVIYCKDDFDQKSKLRLIKSAGYKFITFNDDSTGEYIIKIIGKKE